uniref:CBS domain-containing protein n=1 Tax=Candidatus Methanomethylicus mesodigestus TaxID=1867258 RepID=A0A7C3J2G1_9CREN
MVSLLPSPHELKALRKKAKITQKELAIKAGLSQALIARIESGKVDPRASTLNKILKALNESELNKDTIKNIMHQPVISINATEKVSKAIELLWKNGISQLPVMSGNRVIGCIKEDTILKRLRDEDVNKLLNSSINGLIEESFPIVSIDTNIEEVSRLLSLGNSAVLVSEHGTMVGIVTKIDLIAKHIM